MSTSGGCPGKDTDVEDEAAVLGHFSDALGEMTNSIMGLEEGYFKALCEVIEEIERALRDISQIDAHYVSRVVTVMSSWQEAIQVATTHMEGVDLTTYLAHLEDTLRVTHEYVKEVVKAREERDAAHAVEHENRKEAIRTQNTEDPVVRLLDVTCKAARVHCEKAVDVFIDSIKGTLHKHIPMHSQGPLIANALSTAFQFQMAIWQMIGEECVRSIRMRHSYWCGLVGIVQAIVETFPKNCALMFPPMPMAAANPSFTSTFKPASSDDNGGGDDDDTLGGGGSFHRFETSTPTPVDSGRVGSGGLGRAPSFSSSSLPFGGAFIMASDNVEAASEIPGGYEFEAEEIDRGGADEGLDLGEEADDEGEGEKGRAEEASTKPAPDPDEMVRLKTIIKLGTSGEQPPAAPKTGGKQGSTHINGGAASSESSAVYLDVSHSSTQPKKKGGTPTKVTSPGDWSKEDVNIVCQIQYKADLQHFQTYRTNKIDPPDLACINTVDHSKYLDVARTDPNSVVANSVFSVAAYRAVLEQQGGDVAKFDKEVGTNFKKGAKHSRAPDPEKVPIDRVMLVCQRENEVDVSYSDPDGFGQLVTMGLWDLHSISTLNWAKMQLPSGLVDANFCPLCAFWSTNNETLNNHVHKHYHMGLTCHADGFTTASVASMKAHMEAHHGYKGKCGQAKKAKGKG